METGTDEMTVRIRRARREDAEFLAWVTLSASRSHLARGVWDVIIGADEAGCLDYLRRLAVAEPRSLYHYESFLIAELDGRPGAALSGFEMRADRWNAVVAAMENVQRDLGWTETDRAASKKRSAPLWTCFLADSGADWGIENVATRPECQKRGLARALLDATVEEAAGRGFKLVQISAYIGNTAAQSVYEKGGFRVAEEKRCPELMGLLGTPGFVRLLKFLNSDASASSQV